MVVDPLLGLTAKQCQVLDLLIQHKTSKEISRSLGISPHTVDQRIMLARAKLQVTSRSEVAQAYRRLLVERGDTSGPDIYDHSIYGFSDVARTGSSGHDSSREAADTVVSQVRPAAPAEAEIAPRHKAQLRPDEPASDYYHVLPEAFDGPNGTLLRLGVIAMITVFLTLMILGGLAIYAELSHMLDS